MKKLIAIIILLSAMLPGCTRAAVPSQTQPRLVTKITANYRSGVIELQRQYTNSEKMRAVLNYFRGLEPYGTVAEEPVSADNSRIEIVLTYSDGSTKTYDQRADQYLQVSGGPWQNISAEKGQELGLLLGLMESDEN